MEEEKIEWIKNHGSDYLKDCLELGYDCQRAYVLARAEHELPDFIVDFNDTASWNSRSGPSHEALLEVKNLIEKGYKASVVWLTSEPTNDIGDDDDDDYYDHFEEREAILIEDYLGKYDLIKYMD